MHSVTQNLMGGGTDHRQRIKIVLTKLNNLITILDINLKNKQNLNKKIKTI